MRRPTPAPASESRRVMNTLMPRRQFLSLAVTASALGAITSLRADRAQAAPDPQMVNDKDPVAVALGYTSDAAAIDQKTNPTHRQGAHCANCAWYQPVTGAAAGQCSYFPGKLVNSHGWCRMWSGAAK